MCGAGLGEEEERCCARVSVREEESRATRGAAPGRPGGAGAAGGVPLAETAQPGACPWRRLRNRAAGWGVEEGEGAGGGCAGALVGPRTIRVKAHRPDGLSRV
jgi:hypothetical protein